MTSKNLHNPDSSDRALNRNDRMSDDPDRLGRDRSGAAGKPPSKDCQDETAVEAFSEEGAGIAAKE